MATAGDLVVSLTANTSKFSGGINKARGDLRGFASLASNAISRMLGPIAGVAAGYLSISAAVGVMSRSLTAGREAAQITAKFGAVIDATGNAAGLSSKQYDDMAGSIQKLTNFDDDAATNAMASLAKFGTISGAQFKRALPLAADLASVMETDLTSAAQTLGKALNDPDRGMVTLEKSVGRFTDEQRDLIQGFVDTNDIAGAQGAIMDALAAKVGGAAEKMADPFTQFGNAVDNTMEAIGSNLMAFSESFGPSILGAVEEITGSLSGAVPMVADLGRSIVATMEDAGEVVGIIVGNMDSIWAGLFEDIPKYAGAAFQWITDNAGIVLANIGTMIGNLYATINQAGMQLGEEIAFQIGLSDEVLDIAKHTQKPLQALKPMADVTPSEELTGVANEIDDALKRNSDKRKREAEERDLIKKKKDDQFLTGDRMEQDEEIGGDSRTRYAGAMEQGSQAAYSTIVNAMGAGNDKVAGEQLSVQKQMLKEIRKTGIKQNTPDLMVIERFA